MALRFWPSPASRAIGTHPRTPPRFVVARRAVSIVAATVLIDLMMVTLGYWAAGRVRVDRLHDLPTDPHMLATILCWLIIFFAFGLYGRRQVQEPALRMPVVMAAITASILLTILIAFAFGLHLSRAWVVDLWIMSVGFVFAGRLAVLRLSQHLNTVDWLGLRTVVVGTNAEARTLARVLGKKRYLGFDVLGFVGTPGANLDGLPVIAGLAELRDIVIAEDVAAVFIAGSDVGPDVLTRVDKTLDGLSVRIRTSLGLPHLAASRVVVQAVDGMAMLAVDRIQPSEFQVRLKRALDIGLAAVGIVAGLPLMAAIALAIKLTSDGPAIFAQRRVGAGGQLFTMYKFRTMIKDAERARRELLQANEADGALFKMRLDPRVTPVGRQLRRLGLDELPQLFNVLLGEMSLVGPRPALQEEMESWRPELAMRLKAKPGVTGLWQVSGRHELAFEDYERYDLFYVENWSFVLDLQIIARTIPALLSRAGAY